MFKCFTGEVSKGYKEKEYRQNNKKSGIWKNGEA